MFSEGNRVAYFIIYDIPVDKLNFKKAKVLSSAEKVWDKLQQQMDYIYSSWWYCELSVHIIFIFISQ